MKITKNIAPVVYDCVSKPFRKLADTKLMKSVCDKFEISPEKALAATTIASIVGKDAIGCYMYVKQSLNNEKIPEEKRSFVAALDLTNGGLMILSQLAMFFTISNKKFQGKLFNKFFDKVFSESNKNNYIKTLRRNTKFSNLSKEQLGERFEKIRDKSQDAFRFLTSLIASTTLAKRVIVPFIATPLAGYAKEKYFDTSKTSKNNEVKNKEEVTTTANINKNNCSNIEKEQKNGEPEFKGNLLEKYTNK